MPIYEYLCGACNERFSLLQKINSEEGSARCPSCASPDVKKIMSSFSCSAGSSSACSPRIPSRGFSGGG